MYISRVELENIKSYENADYHFEKGVTAISGPNGVGKTTIIEAIAYALFDSMSHKKDDFLKRGTRKGIVRVTFVSNIDGREYTVYRDTASGFYVYDPITKLRIVEQKNQVVKWISDHLGVDAGVDMKTLFTSTIGVPQGTFTIGFAEQPAKRRVEFDKVLRVEEYQQASDRMRSVIKLLDENDAVLREEIARLDGEISDLDALMAERAQKENYIKQLQSQKIESEVELLQTRLEVERLDALKQRIELQNAEATALTTRIQELEKKQEKVENEVGQSRHSNEIILKSATGFSLYNEATSQLSDLEPQLLKKDELKNKLQLKERENVKVETSLQYKQETLNQLASENKEAERLKPLVQKQVDLENRLSEIQQRLAEFELLQGKAEEDELALKLLRAEYQEVNHKLQEAEEVKSLALTIGDLELQRIQIERDLRDAQVLHERLKMRKQEWKRAKENLAKLTGQITTLETELNDFKIVAEKASALSEFEESDLKLNRIITELRLQISKEKQFVSEIQNGLCPLLSQKCLNMKEGEQLDTYFKFQLADEQKKLHGFEQEQETNSKKLSESRIASRRLSGLIAQQTYLQRHKQEYELENRNIAKLQKEIDDLGSSKSQIQLLTEQYNAIQQEVRHAQAARVKYEGVEPLRNRLKQLKKEGQERRDALKALQSALTEKPEVIKKLDEINASLVKLSDPKSRLNFIERELQKEQFVKEEFVLLSAQSKKIQTEIEELITELKEYALIDETLLRLRTQRDTYFNDYHLYVENQPLARMLLSKELELSELQEILQKEKVNLLEINSFLSKSLSEFDEQTHLTLKAKLELLIGKLAAFSSELNLSQLRVEELQRAIDRLLEVKERINELIKQREKQEDITGTADFMRELLKKAGPFITEAHLQSISIEANQLYREVTGNPLVSLRWDTGYEIIIEEDGHERSFLSLSGGEKMSAALSVRLALLKELSDIRVAFFDEPTANMDEERRRNLAQQIGAVKDFDQLFVVSHDDTFEGFTDRVISIGRDV